MRCPLADETAACSSSRCMKRATSKRSASSSTPLGRSEGGNQLYDAGTASGAILVSATRAPNRLYSSPTSPNAEVLVICKSPSSPVISIWNAGAMMLPALDMNGEHGSACEDALQQQLIRNLRGDLLARFDDCDFRPLVERNGRDLGRTADDREQRVHQVRAEN